MHLFPVIDLTLGSAGSGGLPEVLEYQEQQQLFHLISSTGPRPAQIKRPPDKLEG